MKNAIENLIALSFIIVPCFIMSFIAFEFGKHHTKIEIAKSLDLSDQFVLEDKLFKCQLVTEKVTNKTIGISNNRRK